MKKTQNLSISGLICGPSAEIRTRGLLNPILRPNIVERPHFGVNSAFSLETRENQNFLEPSQFGEVLRITKMLDKC